MKKVVMLALFISVIHGYSSNLEYQFSSEEISANQMPYAWRDDSNSTLKNPVSIDEMRFMKLSHWGFDGNVHTGELVMHKDLASDIKGIFKILFDAKFPIERMELIDNYEGDDSKSMKANNTSALCVRYVANKNRWSNHAFGTAIDINPQQNPYIEEGRNSDGSTYVEPTNLHGTKYVNRKLNHPGMITKDSIIYKAFTKYGWEWGGECFDYCTDLHHFQKIIPGLNQTQN